MRRAIFENLVRISPVEIEAYFKEQPQDLNKKRGIELMAGCVLARAFQHLDGILREIQIPVKNRTMEPPGLAEIIDNPALHVDGDTDLYLKNTDRTAHPVQITVLEDRYTGKDCSDGLINLITRKSHRSPDENMILAVLIDVAGECNLEEVRIRLEAISSPFAFTVLMAQTGDDPVLGRFTCQMIHPDLREPFEIQLNW